MIKTSVVILNWNGEEFLKRFLPLVVKHTKGSSIEIVIADNGSSDGSVKLIKSGFPGIRLIELDKNYGFADGYNKALKQISSEYYVLLNSDIEVEANWLEPLIVQLDKDPNVAAVMPKIRSFHKREYFEYAGAAGGFIDKLGYPFCRGRIMNVIERDEGQYDDITEVFWATGACMALRAEYFHRQDGFDPAFFAHMEEIDLCWRFKNAGHTILYTPGSEVFHVGGGSLPNEHPFKLFLNFRNNLILLYKNLPGNRLIPTMTLRMTLDGVAAMKYLLSLKPKHFSAVIKAHISFYRQLGKYRKYRKSKPANTKELPENIFRGSMILNFYIKGKTKFSDYNFKYS